MKRGLPASRGCVGRRFRRTVTPEARDRLLSPLARAMTTRSGDISLAELVSLQRQCHGSACLLQNLGDGFLYRTNPFYRRVRESAHAVAFHELFGRPRDVHGALSEPSKLVHIVLGEAFARTAEYFAACAVSGPIHAWFFSINSYRHRTPAKKAVGELVTRFGLPLLVWLVLVAFLENNFFVESLPMKTLERALELYPLGEPPAVSRADRSRLCQALRALMVMDPEFREDTARLFLTMHGYRRNIRSVLAAEPLDLIAADPQLPKQLAQLVRALCT